MSDGVLDVQRSLDNFEGVNCNFISYFNSHMAQHIYMESCFKFKGGFKFFYFEVNVICCVASAAVNR